MTDTRTPEQRRRIMTAVRNADTGPELQLRRALHAAGVRGWRCHYKRAHGKPDLAWPSLRVAVFVDGAFWHGHPSRHKIGRSGPYWDEKIARNVERDRQTDAALQRDGWIVVRAWDFEIARELPAVVERVKRALRHRHSPATSNPSFGRNLRDLRQRANLSQRQLADACGSYRSSIGAYERDERRPGPATIAALAQALAIPPETLVCQLPPRASS
ncbi:MAG TPA: DNA mismatch endonuclease Vsr [Solirubrobacteraceae bacterium]|jgi:DNA mismatch endonuclease (patch repair protein)|nr:DNA mismatch endonuclease Vsr [Solirubrobacteraceae bacterium]